MPFVTDCKQYRKRIRMANEQCKAAPNVGWVLPEDANDPSNPIIALRYKEGQVSDWTPVPKNAWRGSEPEWPDIPATVPATTPAWVDTTPQKTAEEFEKERVDNALAGWPWTGVGEQLTTICPFYINTYPDKPVLALPPAQQTSPLFNILRNELVVKKLTDLLFMNHDRAWKFAATCQEAWYSLVPNIDYWDMTDGFFKNCERPRDGPNEEREPDLQGSVASVVVVTTIRNPNGKANYTQQVDNLYKMMLSVNNFADYFRNIQFHRVPFLTIDILELLIPEMRNLKVLGVYKCQLIHIGDTMKLLKIIKKSKLVEYENQVSLDFFPNYHVGPIIVAGNSGTVGSYGVTWDSHDALDTCLGIWALVSQIIPQAKKQGIDFISKHTAFRQWLDKSPCWRVEETLNAMFSHKGPMDDDHFIKIAALVDCRNPSHYGKLRKFMDDRDDKRPEKWLWTIQKRVCPTCYCKQRQIFFDYAQLHNHSIHSGPGLNPNPPECIGCILTHILNTERDHYKALKRKIIHTWLSDLSFSSLSISNPQQPLFNIHTLTTMAHNLNVNTNNNTALIGNLPWATLTSLNQVPTPNIVEELDEQEVNKDNLPLALENYAKRKISEMAAKLDRRRFGQMNPHLIPAKAHLDPIDHEYAEEQKRISEKALTGNRGAFLRSPECGLPEEDENGFTIGGKKVNDGWGEKTAGEWNWAAFDRYKGHGRTQ